MAAKKRGLGRGLDALLGGSVPTRSGKPEATSREEADGELRPLPVDLLQRGRYQPRTGMNGEALEELANSIRAQGVVQPIVVRELETSGRYEIIAGERRWRAAQLAGLHEIPAIIRKVPDQAAIAMALIENIQREELNPMEEAQALQRLIEEFSLTHQEAAEAVGRSRAAVSNLLRLLSLNEDVKRLLENGDIEMGHARALLGLSGEQQSEAARLVENRGLSVRETEQLVRRMANAATKGNRQASSSSIDPNIRSLQEELAEKLGAQVKLQHTIKGKGKLTIHYNSLEELEGILAHIK